MILKVTLQIVTRHLKDFGLSPSNRLSTDFAGGHPKVEEIMAYFPALIPKSLIETTVEVIENQVNKAIIFEWLLEHD